MPIHYQTAKCSLCRREGTKLFLKGEKCLGPKCPVTRRMYPPGQHGPDQRRGKMSVFGKQLREKQKAKRVYGLTEAQFARYVLQANKRTGDTGIILQQLLESRLDNVVFRLGLATSRFEARQRVSHGHIMVNNEKVTIPSYHVRTGDAVTFCNEKPFTSVIERMKKHGTPSWLFWEMDEKRGKMIAEPSKEDFDTSFDAQQIIEYYSR